MFYSLKLLAKIANCKAQGKFEREKYTSIVYVFIFVNEHDSVAKAFLKTGVAFFFLILIFFPFKDTKSSSCPRKEGIGKCVSASTDFGFELH